MLPENGYAIVYSSHPKHRGFHVLKSVRVVKNGIEIGEWEHVAHFTDQQSAMEYVENIMTSGNRRSAQIIINENGETSHG